MAGPAITVDSPIRIDQGCKRNIPGLLSHFYLSSPELYCQYGDQADVNGVWIRVDIAYSFCYGNSSFVYHSASGTGMAHGDKRGQG